MNPNNINQNQDTNSQQATPIQPQTPPQAQNVPTGQPQVIQQYVVTEQSLQGIGGWLIFFIIIFALGSIGYIMIFTTILSTGVKETTDVLTLIFAPILTIASLGSAVTIALQKKIAKYISIATIAIGALYGIINTFIAYALSGGSAQGLPVLVGGILAMIIFYGLIGLYFIVSKRVKQTLIK